MDIIVIGGGASGLFAAIKAKENNPDKNVAILEAQSRAGRKLLSTGNGRCNLTNRGACKKHYHGSFKKYLDTVYEICSVDKVLSEFLKLGLLTKVENDGRVYPVSNHAATVLDTLRFRLEALGVKVICDTTVNDIRKEKNGFEIISSNGVFNCEKVIVCTGSCAAPKLGGDKSGISILQNLGHRITPLSPALCPVRVISGLMTSLKGVRVDCRVSLYDDNVFVKEEYGELQFTESALSGICVFNLSSMLKKNKNPFIQIDLLPCFDRKQIISILKKNKELFGTLTIENLFTGVFIKKLGMAVLKQAGVTPFSRVVSSISDKEFDRVADVIKGWRFEARKTSDFSHAQVASGGVFGEEINPFSMESKLIKNLYICGEAIDIDGDCGGYNLQFAFASGIIAGENV